MGLKLLFIVMAAICSFQLLGLDEAFCDDSPFDAAPCQDCVSCPGHFVADLNEPLLIADLQGAVAEFATLRSFYTQNPAFSSLRPPIAF